MIVFHELNDTLFYRRLLNWVRQAMCNNLGDLLFTKKTFLFYYYLVK